MKKMRKAKLITALALTVVMLVAMTGLASAADMKILPDGDIDLVPSSYVETTTHMEDMTCDGTQRTLIVTVPMGDSGDLTFNVTDSWGGSTTGIGSVSHSYTPAAGTTTYDIKVEIKAATGSEGESYTLYYEDIQSGIWDKASASVPTTAIPEFATIAIPVASILGLLFFFNHRKHKKE